MTPAPPLASKVLARPDPDLRPAHRPEGSSRPDKENVVLLISNGASRRTAGHRRQNRCASLTWPVVQTIMTQVALVARRRKRRSITVRCCAGRSDHGQPDGRVKKTEIGRVRG